MKRLTTITAVLVALTAAWPCVAQNGTPGANGTQQHPGGYPGTAGGAQWQPGEPLKLLFAGYSGTRNTGARVAIR